MSRSSLLVLPLLSLLATTAACTGSPELAPSAAPAPLAARVAPQAAPLVGVLAARTSDVVAAQVDGRITKVIATSGQRVKAGDPIAELDTAVLDERVRAASAAVDAAKADVAGAGAEASEAQRQLQLEQRLFGAGATSLEQVRLAHAAVARAGASVARAEASLREAQAQRAAADAGLAHAHLTAPIDGVVSLVKAQPGEVVMPGAVIARVFDPSGLTVRFQVTRDRRRDVADGTQVSLRIPGVDREIVAKVRTLSADLEPPLDFAVAEADVVGDAPDAPIGSVGDVRVTR
jgi:RND family efflux transporter MFP subunit|nr:efflux RND transporter periplasmic adaptor subunit [Kofleriaceae bacterium]